MDNKVIKEGWQKKVFSLFPPSPHLLSAFLFFAFLCCFFTAPGFARDTSVPEFLRPATGADSLVFERVELVGVDTDGVTLGWETNRRAYSRIKYGTDRADLRHDQTFMNARKEREVSLEGLKEGTNYILKIWAWVDGDNQPRTEWVRFRTEGIPEPEIKRMRMEEITRSGGIVRWETNIPTRALFECGHDSSKLAYKTRHDQASKFHQVKLDDFYPDQQVYYRITATDSRGRVARGPLKNFRTRENNIALDKPVEGTFDRTMYKAPDNFGRGEDLNSRITDGDFTFEEGTATSGDPADTDQWFAVDLEERVIFDTAVIYWFAYAYPRKYEIHGSKEGLDWKKLAGPLDGRAGEKIRKSGINSRKHKIAIDADEEYQYIRIFIPQGASYYREFPQWQYVQVQELKLFPADYLRGGDIEVRPSGQK